MYMVSSSNTQVRPLDKVSNPVISGSNAEITVDTSALTVSSIQFYIYGRTSPSQDGGGNTYYGFTQQVSIDVTCGLELVSASQSAYTLPVYFRSTISGVVQQSFSLDSNIGSLFSSTQPECPISSYQAFTDQIQTTQISMAIHFAEVQNPSTIATASLEINTQQPVY